MIKIMIEKVTIAMSIFSLGNVLLTKNTLLN